MKIKTNAQQQFAKMAGFGLNLKFVLLLACICAFGLQLTKNIKIKKSDNCLIGSYFNIAYQNVSRLKEA